MSDITTIELPSHQALSRLAREDHEAFERLRHELIEQLISHAPAQKQLMLRRLQFRVDGIRARSGSTLGATIKISALMWESFLLLNKNLHQLADTAQGKLSAQIPQSLAPPNRQCARVIPMAVHRPEHELTE